MRPVFSIAVTGMALTVVSGCSRQEPPQGTRGRDAPNAGSPAASLIAPSGKCVVHLHGKSGRGAPSTLDKGVLHLRPEGNAAGWGGRQWLYFPEEAYQEVHKIVQGALTEAHCERSIVHGFSNGAAAAAKMFCRGERFAQKSIGYVIDDPVPDAGVKGCSPAEGVSVRLYWTGSLTQAKPGWSCAAGDWTCEGGSTIGIEAYGRELRTEVTRSVNTSHAEYAEPPEYAKWL